MAEIVTPTKAKVKRWLIDDLPKIKSEGAKP
jgi:hypothetical protein